MNLFDFGKQTADAAALAAAQQTPERNAEFESKLFDPRVSAVNETFTFVARPMPYLALRNKAAVNPDGSPVLDTAGNPVFVKAKNPDGTLAVDANGQPIFEKELDPDAINKSLVVKHYYCVNDQNGRTLWFDSRTTFNKPMLKYYEFCPMSDAWVRTQNKQAPENVKALAKCFSRKTAAYCYMLIIMFPSKPEMVGKVVPMPIPVELKKEFDSLLTPPADKVAMGAKPRLAYDLINGQSFEITATGHMPDGKTLMRKWSVKNWRPADVGMPDTGNQAIFPLGPQERPWVPASELSQEVIIDFLLKQETEDLEKVYGYHEPSDDVKAAIRDYINNVFRGIPGLDGIANTYPCFAHLPAAQPAPQTVGTQAPTVTVGTQAPAAPQAPVAPANPNPAPQPAAPQAPAAPQPGVQAPGVQAPTVAAPGVAAPTAAPQAPAAPQGPMVDANGMPI